MNTSHRGPLSASRLSRRVATLHIILCLLAVATLLVGIDGLSDQQWTLLAPLVSAVVLLNGVFLYGSGVSVWTASGAFGLVLCLFHFGIVLLLGVGVIGFPDLTNAASRWLDSGYGRTAALLSLLGWIAFACGVQCQRLLRPPHRPSAPVRASDSRLYRISGIAGTALVLGGVGLWLTVLRLSGGLELATGPYLEYLEATEPYTMLVTPIWVLLSIGMILLGGAEPGRTRTFGWMVFGLFAVVALPLGLRGEVLFPLVATGVVMRRHGWMPSRQSTALMMATALLAIGVLRTVRAVGVRDLDGGVGETAAWAGLAELGGSLQPVQKVVEWRAGGEPHTYGATYWAPVERGMLGLFPVVERLPASDDKRLMNVVVAERVGQIGFSVVAEGFRNFGAAGVAGVLLLIGVLLAYLDTLPQSTRNDLRIGVILVPLLLHVRNSFVPVPSQVMLGLLVIWCLSVVSRLRLSGRATWNGVDSATMSHSIAPGGRYVHKR